MLSHHELATLLLLRDTNLRFEEFDSDMLALCRYELVEVRGRDPRGSMFELTTRGRDLLRRLRLDGAADPRELQ